MKTYLFRLIAKRIFRALIVLVFISLFACALKQTSPPFPNDYYHIVSYQGETLSAIAAWYTGSAKNWPKILRKNPNLNPYRIRRGDRVIVPRSLLVQDKSMPESFINSKKPEPEPEPERLIIGITPSSILSRVPKEMEKIPLHNPPPQDLYGELQRDRFLKTALDKLDK